MSEEQAEYIVEVHPEAVGVWEPQATTDGRMALAAINDAEAALDRATEIGDILMLRDKASAAVKFAIARGYREAAQKAKIYQLKAERKAGLWLAENVADGADVRWHDATGLPEGVDKYESSRWQLEASLPEERFNEWVDYCIAHEYELSAGALRKIASNHQAKENGAEPGAADIAALKRIFYRWWPTLETPDYAEAYEHMAALSALVLKRAEAK